MLEVELAKAPRARRRGSCLAELPQELRLGDLALLELEQRMLAGGLGAICIALPELLEGHARLAPGTPGSSHSGLVRTPPKSEMTALAHAAAGGSSRTVSS